MKQDAGTYDLRKETGKFAVSVLGTGQKDLAFAFLRHVEPDDGKFGDYTCETKTTRAPLIADVPAWFECEVVNSVKERDHAIVIGRVVEAGVRDGVYVLTPKECGVNYGGGGSSLRLVPGGSDTSGVSSRARPSRN